jgi:hypothetical protein
MVTTYADFSVGIESAADGGYLVHAFSHRAEAESAMDFPFDLPELSGIGRPPAAGSCPGNAVRDARAASGAQARPGAEEAGRVLFAALFPGPVGELYASEWSAAMDAGQGLRIRLHLRPENPALAWLTKVPWELLFDKRAGGFLCLNPLTPLVRHLNLARPVDRVPLCVPIRVLVVASNPSGLPPLALRDEQRQIEAAQTGRKRVEVTMLENVSPEELREELIRGRYQVVHFMGHGLTEADDGSLLFSTPGGHPRRVTGREMSQLVQGSRATQLVILNACHSAGSPKNQEADPLAGVAGSLVGGGQPAVLGMQLAVSDSAALTFSGKLYQRLAEGDPLEAAVAEARLAVYLADRSSTDWFAPVLFLRGADERMEKSSMKKTEKDVIRTIVKASAIEGEDEVDITGESIEGLSSEQTSQRPQDVHTGIQIEGGISGKRVSITGSRRRTLN